jgi:hypothetical protein
MRRLAIVSTVVPPSAFGQAFGFGRPVVVKPPHSCIFVAPRVHENALVMASSGATVGALQQRFRPPYVALPGVPQPLQMRGRP